VTNGNDLKKEAVPFSLTLPVPPPGAEGGNPKRGEAASAQSKPAISAPHRILGAEMRRNKQRRERSDPPLGDGSATCHDKQVLLFGVAIARRRFLHQRTERAP